MAIDEDFRCEMQSIDAQQKLRDAHAETLGREMTTALT
jgi:hypothetical protein